MDEALALQAGEPPVRAPASSEKDGLPCATSPGLAGKRWEQRQEDHGSLLTANLAPHSVKYPVSEKQSR